MNFPHVPIPHKIRDLCIKLHVGMKELLIFLLLASFIFVQPSTVSAAATQNDQCKTDACITLGFDQVFGSLWKSAGLTTFQIAIPLDVTEIGNNPIQVYLDNSKTHIDITKSAITFYNREGKKIFSEIKKSNTDKMNVLFESNANDRYQVQIVQTVKRRYAEATPFITWDGLSTKKTPVIRIEGSNGSEVKPDQFSAIVGNNNVFRKVKRKRDTKGLLLCYGVPIFAIANILLDTHCDLQYFENTVEHLFSSKKKGYAPVVGDIKPSHQQPAPHYSPLGKSSVLSRIIQGTEKKPFLSAYAAAKTCEVPLDVILSNRKPRGNEDTNDCIYSTSDLINIYTRVFGTTSQGQWNQGHFNQLVYNVLTTGATGDPHFSPEDEKAFALAVHMQQTIANIIKISQTYRVTQTNSSASGSWLAEQSFANAQAAYTSYLQSAERAGTPPPLLTPQQVQERGALGIYRIDVEDFDEHEIPAITPRVFKNKTWRQDNTNAFTTEVRAISDLSQEQRRHLLNTAQQWGRAYRETHLEYDEYLISTNVALRSVAQAMSTAPLAATHLIRALDNPNNEDRLYSQEHTYVAVTRYQGRVVNMLLVSSYEAASDNEDNDEDIDIEWEIDYALTEPSSVIPVNLEHPNIYHDGAVRGAGQAALRALVLEAQDMHVHTVAAQVVSIPSAFVFNKIGFTLVIPKKDEL